MVDQWEWQANKPVLNVMVLVEPMVWYNVERKLYCI